MSPTTSFSAFTQDGIKVRQHFRRVPFLHSDDLPRNLPLTVDDVGFRDHDRAIRLSDGRMIVFGGWIAVRRKDYPVFAQKVFVNIRVLICSDAQNNAVARSNVFLQPVQRGGFFNARRAPRSPEIQHHDLAAKIGKMSRLAVKLQREILRSLSRDGCLAMPVTRQRKNDNYPEKSRQASPSHNFRANFHRMLY
jgi:hypothetical protein